MKEGRQFIKANFGIHSQWAILPVVELPTLL